MSESGRGLRRQMAVVCITRALFDLRKAIHARSQTETEALLKEALEHCDEAIENDSTFADAWLARSNVHLAMGNRESFKADFLRGAGLVQEAVPEPTVVDFPAILGDSIRETRNSTGKGKARVCGECLSCRDTGFPIPGSHRSNDSPTPIPHSKEKAVDHVFTLDVKAPDGMSRKRVLELVDMLLGSGRTDAIQTCNDGLDESGTAAEAIELDIAVRAE